MKKQRESNFELLRIIAMLMIITGHTISWGGIENVASPNVSSIIIIIYAFIMVEVNVFVLLSGFFQSQSKFKFDKFIKLLLISYFYKALITYVCYKCGYIDLSRSSLLWNLSPFDFSNYWFIKLYLVLYCLSPFLNKFIHCITKRNYEILLIILFIFCSVMTTVTDQEIFVNSGGFSLIQFIFMYLIGAYISKYIITKEKKDKLYSNKKELLKNLYIFLSIYLLSVIANYFLYRFGAFIVKYGGWLEIIGNRLKTNYMHYDNPLVIVGSIGLFLTFSLIKIKSKLINFFASTVFSVYLIHETVLFRPILYSFFGLNNYNYISSYRIFGYLILIVISIFFACTVIENLRCVIFTFLNKIFNKIRFFKYLKNRYNLLCKRIDGFLNI